MATNRKRGFPKVLLGKSGQPDRVADSFYEEIRSDQINLYQRYLDALFTVIDVDNYSRWSRIEAHDSERLDRDAKLIERVCREEGASHGLEPAFLQTMIHQYVFADQDIREEHQKSWAETVVYSRKRNFFPSGEPILRLFGLKDEK